MVAILQESNLTKALKVFNEDGNRFISGKELLVEPEWTPFFFHLLLSLPPPKLDSISFPSRPQQLSKEAYAKPLTVGKETCTKPLTVDKEPRSRVLCCVRVERLVPRGCHSRTHQPACQMVTFLN
ncbi:hypothetical protein SLEP1_g34557 [Rubroshorea leprosula]|uniref:EF-hand domain-containing protein n=1 Tax=Rubroshorea leprosula TaxID=152421 RepID=A0AAV5KKL6_9ROSI|nr:hypothetical protein SLEP1_g34557 [Rubroshorea leprosula]